jgi:hypothetical protein
MRLMGVTTFFCLTAGLIGFMLFLVLVLFFLSIFLLVPPILFNRYDKLGGLARFLKERRSQWVLQGLGVVGSLFGSVVLTASGMFPFPSHIYPSPIKEKDTSVC